MERAQEGTKLPEKITVILKRNGEAVDRKEVTAKDGWSYSWTGLEAYSSDGKTAYTYTVEEEPIEGYKTAVSGYNITNTITGTTKVEGTKTWNVPEGTAVPEKITVVLNRDGIEYKRQTVTAGNGWKYSFDNLPKYSEDGKAAYTYTVDEVAVTGYNKTVNGYNITNTKSDKVNVEGTKTWNVPEGTKLPEKITVILKRNGEAVDRKEVTAKDGWRYSWTGLEAYSSDGKTAYTYTVEEEPIEGYKTAVSGYNITNTITGTTKVEGTKTWNVPEGTAVPEKITVVLNRDGIEYKRQTVTAGNGWKYSFDNLPKYSEDGKAAYTYTVDEVAVTGYNKTVNGYNITNTITGTTKVEGKKTWNVPEGTKLPEKITVILKRNGEAVDRKEVTAKDGWSYSWTGLEAYSSDGKTAYTYTVEEEPIEGYKTAVSGYNITNTITGTTKVEGTKTWNVPEGTAVPEKITVVLNRDGIEYKRQTVTAGNGWKYSFDNLPKYSEDGKAAYTYTVDEVAVTGYNKTVNGYNITNTITGTTKVRGKEDVERAGRNEASGKDHRDPET